MLQLNKILFPVDFSERSLGASRFVRAMTERFHAELTLLHVVEPATSESLLDRVTLRKMELQQFLHVEFRPFRIQRLVREGDPAHVIASTAQSEQIDLIMMPTHGWGACRRLLLGSVTARILREADCLVWTCVHAEEVSREKPVCRKVLCAVDFGQDSGRIVHLAQDLARSHHAALLLAHVCQQVPLGEPALCIAEWDTLLHAQALEKMGALVADIHPAPEVTVKVGDVAANLRTLAIEMGADLIVIGRSAAGSAMGRLRSEAYSIIRQSPCPVISM